MNVQSKKSAFGTRTLVFAQKTEGAHDLLNVGNLNWEVLVKLYICIRQKVYAHVSIFLFVQHAMCMVAIVLNVDCTSHLLSH